jgi:hypothetical protein
LFEYLEEEESKKKRARASEDNGDGRPSASSSGPDVEGEPVHRSRGGGPMATDSGDSVPETAKKKLRTASRERKRGLEGYENKIGKEGERGAKTSSDDWEELAKRLKTSAEARAEESNNPGEGMDINQSHVARGTSSINGRVGCEG